MGKLIVGVDWGNNKNSIVHSCGECGAIIPDDKWKEHCKTVHPGVMFAGFTLTEKGKEMIRKGEL